MPPFWLEEGAACSVDTSSLAARHTETGPGCPTRSTCQPLNRPLTRSSPYRICVDCNRAFVNGRMLAELGFRHCKVRSWTNCFRKQPARRAPVPPPCPEPYPGCGSEPAPAGVAIFEGLRPAPDELQPAPAGTAPRCARRAASPVRPGSTRRNELDQFRLPPGTGTTCPIQLAFTTAGGCQVPLPGGRIDGLPVDGQ